MTIADPSGRAASQSGHHVLMVGFQQAGKTSFVAALWEVVRHGDLDGALWLADLDDDSSYLNEIHSAWINLEDVGRTADTGLKHVVLRLAPYDGGPVTTLTIPDMSGELYEHAVDKRIWSAGFDQLARDADGILLFIHVGAPVRKPVTIRQRNALLGQATASVKRVPASVPQAAQSGQRSFVLSDMPTQARYVDLLRLIHRAGEENRIRRIALVLSAWDVVQAADRDITPEDWFRAEFPLLWQYMQANSDEVKLSIYGVSALGGDVSKPDVREDLRRILDPAKRVKVIGPDAQPHDISAPIRWLMEA